jgi:uncharacterized protein involved in exopolysaccharide biosynthesis
MAFDPHADVPGADGAAAGFDVMGLIGFLWGRKWLIAGVTLAAVIGAIVYLNLATYRYSAQLRVTPAQTNGGSISGGLGALASLAGADLSRVTGGTSFPLYVTTLRSRDVAAVLASDPAIMQHVFKRQWNADTKQWQDNPGLVGTTADAIKSLLGIPSYAWRAPNADDMQKYLDDHLDVVEDVKRSITTIKIQDEDPAQAAAIITRIHTASDAAIRLRTLERTTQYIDYLEKKLPLVTIAEQRDALAKTLSDQEKLRMQASATVGFAAEPLNSVEVSPRPVSPRPMLTLLGALVGGLVAGIGIALATTLVRKPLPTPASGGQ